MSEVGGRLVETPFRLLQPFFHCSWPRIRAKSVASRTRPIYTNLGKTSPSGHCLALHRGIAAPLHDFPGLRLRSFAIQSATLPAHRCLRDGPPAQSTKSTPCYFAKSERRPQWCVSSSRTADMNFLGVGRVGSLTPELDGCVHPSGPCSEFGFRRCRNPRTRTRWTPEYISIPYSRWGDQ